MIVIVYYIPQSILANFPKVYTNHTFFWLELFTVCQMAVSNIRCNIGVHDLPYIGCLKPKNTGYQISYTYISGKSLAYVPTAVAMCGKVLEG